MLNNSAKIINFIGLIKLAQNRNFNLHHDNYRAVETVIDKTSFRLQTYSKLDFFLPFFSNFQGIFLYNRFAILNNTATDYRQITAL